MTEKRFEMKDPNCWGYPITDNKTGTVYNCNSNIWMKELVGVLNALHEENKSLKKQLDDTIDLLAKEINSSENAFEGLLKENQHIKQTIIEAYQTERTEIGKSVLKQLIEQME